LNPVNILWGVLFFGCVSNAKPQRWGK